MLINFMKNTSLWCINHDEPKEMKLVNNTEIIKTPFFACGENILDNDGTLSFTKKNKCANRFNCDDFLKLGETLNEIVDEKGIGADLTNYTFYFKGSKHKYFVKVIKYSSSEIKLGIRNLSILGGK